MSHLKNKNYLILTVLIGALFFGLSMNYSNWLTISKSDIERDIAPHSPRFYSLLLWSSDIGIKVEDDKLVITNGIVVWSNWSESVWSNSASIWWWKGNNIKTGSHYAWIAWWESNTIDNWWVNSFIWWWNSNNIVWSDAVVAWWENNNGYVWGNVLWWNLNTASTWWVVFWWSNNEAGINSLALWSSAKSLKHSFSWNAEAEDYSAMINASRWILIWTTSAVEGVNLVVDWAVKLWWSDAEEWTAWEIRAVDGCFYAFDWIAWHVINRNTADNCTAITVSDVCKFWNIELQEWDVVTGYNATLAVHCESARVTCTDGALKDSWGGTSYSHPYCYEFRPM